MPAPVPVTEVLLGIESARDLLNGIDTLPLAEAATRFEGLHLELQAALSDLDHA